MKNFFQKLLHNTVAISIIGGILAIALVGGTIFSLVYFLDKSSENTAKNKSQSSVTASGNMVSSIKSSTGNSSVNSAVSGNSSAANASGALQNSTNNTGSKSSSVSSKSTSSKEVSSALPANRNDYKAMALQNKNRAQALAKQYYKDFFNEPNKILLATSPSKKSPEVEGAWGYGGLMSMQCMMAKINKTTSEINLMKTVIQGLDYYGYQKNGKLWGYVVYRGDYPLGATNAALAYDDNIWLAINFIQAYQNTGTKAYLDKAKYIMDFLIREAWFEPLGGFFWDTRHDARHSCSNNPAIKPLVDLYKLTKEKKYLDWAKKVYDFSYKNLKNNDLNIYEDLIKATQKSDESWVEGSSKNTGFYSYNTGAMISGASALYGATGEQKYLNEALACAKGAYDYFGIKNQKSGYVGWPCDNGKQIWFQAILLRGYIDLYPYAKEKATKYIEVFQDTMDYSFENYYDGKYIPYNWLMGWDSDDRETYKRCLDQSTNVEMFAMLSDWQSRRTK
ncbi:MAG: putative glycosyl hydrolase [Oscillospiraceae bacterium]|nr:putative glycosyl hydrolase [Oscillospiraceae bacterium]